MFKEIQIAYETLSDNYSRYQYDKKLSDYQMGRKPEQSEKSSSSTSYSSQDYQSENRGYQNNNSANPHNQSNPQPKSKENSNKSNFGCGTITVVVLTLLTFWFLWKQCSKKADYNDENLGYVDSAVAVVDSAALVVDSAAAVIDEAAYETYNSIHENYGSQERPLTYTSLKNGDSPLNDCFGNGKFQGQAFITFKNQNETDAIVCLVNYSTDKTIRNEYIKAGNDYTMRKIPSGTYFLKVYYGNDWNYEKQNFCGSNGGFNFDESFSKSDGVGDLINIENSRSGYTTGTITLYKVANGNMSSEQINEQEFFK